MTDITIGYIRNTLSYDPDTGIFRWKSRDDVRLSIRHIFKGQEAGIIAKNGYRVIRIMSQHFLGQRLAWVIMTGEWPKEEMDHINGVRADNRWTNLRSATKSQNCVNRKVSSRNTSGYKGVSLERRTNKWLAAIKIAGRSIRLSTYATPEEAHVVYVAASKKAHGEFFNDGRSIREATP